MNASARASASTARDRPRPTGPARRLRTPTQPDRGRERLEALLALEGEMREAGNVLALHQETARGLARLLGASGVLLFHRPLHRWRAIAASPSPSVDRRTPVVRAAERAVRGDAGAEDLADALGWPTGQVLIARTERSVLVAALPAPPSTADKAIARRALQTHAHAAECLAGPGPRALRRMTTRPAATVAAIMAAALLAVPVPLTVLAEAEIVGRAPYTVAAPMDGVVRELLVEPQSAVRPGDALVVLDDTVARGSRDLAERELAVAEARLARATNGSGDAAHRAEAPVLRAERDLAVVRLANANAQLERTTVRAATAGVATMGDPSDWNGRPVRTGERILQLVDPADVELAIRIAPADLIELPVGAGVTVHLDAAPLDPLHGRLGRIATAATELPGGTLAYEARAALDGEARLGARGIARLSGERVPLAYLILRRPIAMVRQVTGW